MALTFLTEPLTSYYRVRTAARNYIKKIPHNYGGHYGVTRSLFDGFAAIGFSEFNYRPALKNVHEHVHVLSGVPGLKYAIDLKKTGKVERVTAGPNIIGLPDDTGWEYLVDDNVDLLLFPSQNTIDYFEHYIPGIKSKSKPFASGVNEKDFSPKDIERDQVLIYLKDVNIYWGQYISFLLQKRGFKSYIISYGFYNLEEYKQLLNRSLFMISLSKHDTQGIYLAEAWAMDCPTVCWNSHFCAFPTTKTVIEGNQLGSPYVCNENGKLFDTMEQLEAIIDTYPSQKEFWHPREWVLNNMTDGVCSRNFLDLILCESK